jgi:signal transduction histidine kinase
LLSSRQQRALLSGHAFALDEIQQVIDGLVEQVALIDSAGTIIAVNKRWKRQVERHARVGLHISRDYEAFLQGLIDRGDEGVIPILRAFREIAAGARPSFHCIYNGTGAFAGYDFNVAIAKLRVHQSRYILVSVSDVTELVALKRQRRRVGSQLLRAQEDERRRMARELHDSTSQSLVALQLTLSRLDREQAGERVDSIVGECRELLKDVQREIRAFSFLAHPPSLLTNRLETALSQLVSGFAARTGLQIASDISPAGETCASIEAAIYRVSQEALSNIYRHARATRATFRLVARKDYIHLLISDNGVGVGHPAEPHNPRSIGVGLMGMGERVRELGGRLSFGRASHGTSLTVSFPRGKRMIFLPAVGAPLAAA